MQQRNIRRRKTEEIIVVNLLKLSGLVSIGTTIGIIYVLGSQSIPFFGTVSLKEFVTGLNWTPLFVPQEFGVMPLINGTFMVAIIAALVALIFGLGSAFFSQNMLLEK